MICRAFDPLLSYGANTGNCWLESRKSRKVEIEESNRHTNIVYMLIDLIETR